MQRIRNGIRQQQVRVIGNGVTHTLLRVALAILALMGVAFIVSPLIVWMAS
jgi:hypothetical protein